MKLNAVTNFYLLAVAGLMFFSRGSIVSAGSLKPVNPDDPLTQFKQFLAAPPIIDTIVCRCITTSNPYEGLAVDEGAVSANDSLAYLVGRWQPDCIFLKSGTNLDVVLPGRQRMEEIDARYHDEYWRLAAPGFLSFWNDPAKSIEDIYMKPSIFFTVKVHLFRELMNMGVMHLDVGVIKWDNDNFHASGYHLAPNVTEQIAGQVIANTAGYPKEIDVEYRNRLARYNYILRYSYRTNVGLPFLPSTIQSFFISAGKEIKMEEWDILSVRTRATLLERSAYELESLVATNNLPSIQYTNDSYYAKNLVGQWAPITTRDGRISAFRQLAGQPKGPRFYLGTVIVSTVIAFSSVWRRIKRNKKQQIQVII